jgi:hypothetical protein
VLTLRNLVVLAILGLLGAAIKNELAKPAEERDWHGTIAGLIPYDFRPPSLDRLRQAWWNPDDERIFTPHAFGIGWSINIGRIAWLLGFDLPMAGEWDEAGDELAIEGRPTA